VEVPTGLLASPPINQRRSTSRLRFAAFSTVLAGCLDFAIKTIQEATDSGIPQQFIGIDDGPASGGHDSNSFVFAFTLVPPKQASKHIAPFLLDANYTLSHPRNQ
jgi:hypothetical protein